MISSLATSASKKVLRKYSETGQDDDPNHIAARHAIQAIDAYDDLRLAEAFKEINLACSILNEHHEGSNKLKKLVASAAEKIREARDRRIENTYEPTDD